MARSVLNPRLRLPVGERERDERGPQVVDADAATLRRGLEERRALHARELETGAEPFGLLVRVERLAVLVDEDAAARRHGAPGLLPGAQGSRRAGRQRPRPRVVGLVAVERYGAAREVEIAPRQRRRLSRPHPFAREEAVEHPQRKRYRCARQKNAVLVRVEVGERLRRPDRGQEAAGQRVGGETAQREHRERKHAVKQLRDVTPRRGRE
ncbi:MAG TPA: hypothetical protein VGM56_18335 [Byssovorax sp.]